MAENLAESAAQPRLIMNRTRSESSEERERQDAMLQQRGRQSSPVEPAATGLPNRLVLDVLRGQGRPLDVSVRRGLEQRLGSNLSRVRIHTGSEAARAVRHVNAAAITVGQHIALPAGRHHPDTSSGLQLLAHEVAHTIQHRRSSRHASGISKPTDASEKEAVAAARTVVDPSAPVPDFRASANLIHRQPRTAAPHDPLPPGSDTEHVSLNLAEVYFRALPNARLGVLNLNASNYRAQELITRVRQAGESSNSLAQQLSFLEWTQATGGERDLAAVRESEQAVRSASRGRSGQYVREAVERYVNANSAMRPLVGGVRETQARIAAASGRVHAAVLGVEELEAERSEEAARSAVEEVRTNIEAAKSRAGQVVDVAKNLLQGKWNDAGVDLAAIIGEELIGAAIDAAYAGDLAAAEEKLSAARANLERVQDERHASILNSEVNGLVAANEAGNVAQAALLAGARRAEQAHATLTETLDEMGHGSAATALEARIGLRQAAARTAIGLQQYMELIQSIQSRSTEFTRLSGYIAEFLQSPGGESYVPARDMRTALWARADHNRGMAETLGKWAVRELGAARRAENYVQTKSYMQSYEEMDVVLQQALTLR